MADVIGKLVSIEATTMKLQKDSNGKWTEVQAPNAKFVFKFLLQSGEIKRVTQQGSEKALKFAKERVFPTHGLEGVLPLLPLLNKKIPIWEKQSEDPQYKPSWQFSQKPAGQAPPVAPPAQPAPHYPVQDQLPNMPAPPPPEPVYPDGF